MNEFKRNFGSDSLILIIRSKKIPGPYVNKSVDCRFHKYSRWIGLNWIDCRVLVFPPEMFIGPNISVIGRNDVRGQQIRLAAIPVLNAGPGMLAPRLKTSRRRDF